MHTAAPDIQAKAAVWRTWMNRVPLPSLTQYFELSWLLQKSSHERCLKLFLKLWDNSFQLLPSESDICGGRLFMTASLCRALASWSMGACVCSGFATLLAIVASRSPRSTHGYHHLNQSHPSAYGLPAKAPPMIEMGPVDRYV